MEQKVLLLSSLWEWLRVFLQSSAPELLCPLQFQVAVCPVLTNCDQLRSGINLGFFPLFLMLFNLTEFIAHQPALCRGAVDLRHAFHSRGSLCPCVPLLRCPLSCFVPFILAGMTPPAPSQQHRQPNVSPLSLSADSRRPQSQQMSPTLSPLSPITQVGVPGDRASDNWREFPGSPGDSDSSFEGRGDGCIVSGAAASPVPVFYPDDFPAAAAAPGGEQPASEHSVNADFWFTARSSAAPALRHSTFHHPTVSSGQPEPEPAIHGNRHQLGKLGQGWKCGTSVPKTWCCAV